MRDSSIGALLRRLYLAASELHCGDHADRLRHLDAVLVATCTFGETCPRFDLRATVSSGDSLFHVARGRVTA